MRILFCLFTLGLISTAAFGQGTVTFNNNTGSGSTRVYLPGAADLTQRTGNTATQNPAGTQVYTGALLSGSFWTAQLFAIPGNTLPAGPFTFYGVPVTDTFVAATPTTTFRTGSAAGIVAAVTATLPNVAPDASSAVLQLRVFPTSYGTWSSAVAAWNGGLLIGTIGASEPFIVNTIGGNVNTPPNLTGLLSFSLAPFPEPSSVALFGLGMGYFLAARRKSKSNPDV